MWRDLKVVVGNLPQDSATTRAVLGEDYHWNHVAQLLASAVDELRLSNWYQTEDAQKRRNRPQPIPRPGVDKKTVKRRAASSIEDMAERLQNRHLSVVDP